jgi:hypothetical protein
MLTSPLSSAVFSKSYCPYCRATKSLLTEVGARFYTIELDQVGKEACHPFPTLFTARFPEGSNFGAPDYLLI